MRRVRSAVHVEKRVTGVAEEAAKIHAHLGQPAAIHVPMMQDGPDEAPSEEAEREKLRTLPANLDASIAALTRRVTRMSTRSCRPSRRSANRGKQEAQGVYRGRGVRQGSAHGQAEVDPTGGATYRGPQPGHHHRELQPVARAILQRSGATVPASTTAGTNAGSGAAAALACSLAAGCRCGNGIDRKWGGRRQQASFRAWARDEVSTLLEPEQGLEMLTAGQ